MLLIINDNLYSVYVWQHIYVAKHVTLCKTVLVPVTSNTFYILT